MLNRIQRKEVLAGLLQLGLQKKESAVYFSVLENNDSSIPSIAKDTGLSRGTVYDIVEKLKEKGFLTEIKKDKKRRITAENPTNKLYSMLDAKHNELQKSKKIVENILPTINTLSNHKDNFKPQVRIYEREKGFRKVWDEIFSYKGKKFLGIVRVETFHKFAGENIFQEIQERKVKLGFKSLSINELSDFAKKLKETDSEYNRETRLAPKEFQFPSSEIIFGDKVAMFSTQDENISVVIESKDFAETHRAYFEMIWRFLA